MTLYPRPTYLQWKKFKWPVSLGEVRTDWEGHGKDLPGEDKALDLDRILGYTDGCTCPNSTKAHLRCLHFIEHKFYIKNTVNRY